MELSTIQENNQTKFGEIEEILDDVETSFNQFKNFDILNNPPTDHRYHYKIFSRMPSRTLFRISEKYHVFRQKIEKEWSLLQENLPDSIFVRAYKDIDFMRVVIVNPPHAPFYPNGLFFFDLLFPSNYPSHPPKIRYRDDYFLNMIPNLDSIGKWDKKTSTILHALLEMKNRVFNARPNSNEGLRSFIIPEFIKSTSNVVKDTKKAMVLNHKGMLSMLRGTPPTDFEVFVEGYFRTRAHVILCSYMSGLDRVGADDELVVLLRRLIINFERNGTYCKHHLVRVDKLMKEVHAKNLSKITHKVDMLAWV